MIVLTTIALLWQAHRWLSFVKPLMPPITENPVTSKDSEAITKSYPDFFEDWNLLGGNANGI